MKFSSRRFNRHLDNLGQNYKYRRSFACPCFNRDSGAADPKCTLCLGKGRYWESAVDARAATASQKTQMHWAKMGMYEDGDIVITVPENSPIWNAGQYDRIIMMNATDKFSEPLVRGAPTDRLIFAVNSIERVFWLDPTTREIVEGGIPAVDDKGRLTWDGGIGEPPPGMKYSITGTKLCEYYLLQDLPRNRNMHTGMRLPKMVVLRRFDLLNRRQSL